MPTLPIGAPPKDHPSGPSLSSTSSWVPLSPRTKGKQWRLKVPFLGLDFDFTSSLRSGQVRFFVRERLVSKVLEMVDTAVVADHLPAGQAAKLYGVCNFLEQGMYGRVGAGGLAAIRERADLGGGGLTPPICSSLELIRSVVDARPSRVFELFTRELPRFVAASDAAEDEPGQGTGGFHLVWLDAPESPEVRESFWAQIGSSLYALFLPGDFVR